MWLINNLFDHPPHKHTHIVPFDVFFPYLLFVADATNKIRVKKIKICYGYFSAFVLGVLGCLWEQNFISKFVACVEIMKKYQVFSFLDETLKEKIANLCLPKLVNEWYIHRAM